MFLAYGIRPTTGEAPDMATAKITLPTGITFRTATQRRYVCVYSYRGSVTIAKRSDTLATVEAEYNRHSDTVESGDSATRTRWFVVDTVTGETLRRRDDDAFRWV